MTKINYTPANGKEVEVEVNNEIAEIEVQFLQEQKREHWRNKKRKAKGKNFASLDYLKDKGIEIEDKNQDTFALALENIDAERIHKALARLPSAHQELVDKVFFQEIPLKNIAQADGVTYQAIQNRLSKILVKMNNPAASREVSPSGCL